MKERLLSVLVGLAVLASAALSGLTPLGSMPTRPAIVVADDNCQGGTLCLR